MYVNETPEISGVEMVGEGAFAVPKRLPVRSLSHSSMRLWKECPEKWRRRYVEGASEPSRIYFASGKGLGAGIARGLADRLGIEAEADAEPRAGKLLDSRPELREAIGDTDDPVLVRAVAAAVEAFDSELAEVELSGDEDPDRLRAALVEPVVSYLTEVAAELTPLSVERRARFAFPDAEWSITAYLDVEYAEAGVVDVKSSERKHVSQAEAEASRQLRIYSLARRAEGAEPDGYLRAGVHSGRIGRINPARTKRWEVRPVSQTEELLDETLREIARIAREIARSGAVGEWARADGEGFGCRPGPKGCPFWDRCPGGGLLRPAGG
jgi:hypothetical protein